MAASRPQTTEGSDGGDGDQAPPAFRRAVAALTAAAAAQDGSLELTELPAPRRLAPHAYALAGLVSGPADGTGAGEEEETELAGGRFVLLHDPAGQEAWQGTFRVVTLSRAELEPEMAADPLLPEVAWSWLMGALESRAAAYGRPSGTVTRSASAFFGGMASRAPHTELELRASWTPYGTAPDAPPEAATHLAAWAELLRHCAGLPPEQSPGGSVLHLPRRGPHPL